MAKQIINGRYPIDYISVGTTENAHNGEPLRSAFIKINDAIDKIDANFNELYNADASDLGNFNFTANQLRNFNGGSINNSDASHGSTAYINFPANGSGNTELLNYYGGLSISTSASGVGDLKVWQFNQNGSLSFPNGETMVSQPSQLYLHKDENNFVGEIVLQAGSAGLVATHPVNGSGNLIVNPNSVTLSLNNNTWEFNNSGTLNTPTLFPVSFTAVLDQDHMVDPVGLVPMSPWWQFAVQFQVDPTGNIATMLDNPFPIEGNPGYVSGYTFRFTEIDHGIPGYIFDITLNDVVNAGGAGWTANPAVTQAPEYPSTIRSQGAIKLTADSSSFTFGTDGNLKLPVGGDIQDSNGVSVLGGGSNANTGTITFQNDFIFGSGTPDGDYPLGRISIFPNAGSPNGQSLLDYGQYLDIYPTIGNDAPHIHIAPGKGGQLTGDLILGNDQWHVDVNHQGNIYIKSYDQLRGYQNWWSFETNGTLSGPGMGNVIVPGLYGTNGQDLYLGGGGPARNVSSLRFLDADNTAKDTFTIDLNTYSISGIPTNGGVTLWVGGGVSVGINSIVDNLDGTATVTLNNIIPLDANTDYNIEWYGNDQHGVTLTSNGGNMRLSETGDLFVPDEKAVMQNYSATRTVQGQVLNSAGVIWSAMSSAVTTAKLTIQVEAQEVGGDGPWHTQVCEAVIAGRIVGGEPAMTVYAITHTSVDDLATFTVQRNVTSGAFEVIVTPTVTNASGGVDYRVHSVELYSRD